MFMDAIDRLVFVQVFNEMKRPGKKKENNPYKQGSVSFHAWNEGFEYFDLDRKAYENKELTPILED